MRERSESMKRKRALVRAQKSALVRVRSKRSDPNKVWVIPFIEAQRQQSRSSPAAVGLTEALMPLSAEALWGAFMWKGKPGRRRAWLRALKKAHWLQELCARTCGASAGDPIEVSLTRWLAEVRVRGSQWPESAKASKMRAQGSSSTSFASLKSASQSSSSGKTSRGPKSSSQEFSKNLRASATGAKPSSFELLTWVRPIDERESSSWPTATKQDSSSSARHWCASAESANLLWATPAAGLNNYRESTQSFEARSQRLLEAGTRPLGANLGQQAQMWRTPSVQDGSGTGAENPTKRQAEGHSIKLKDQACSHQVPTTSKGGSDTSMLVAPRRLNPAFVEALMGWAVGASMPFGLTDCGCSETASCQPRPKKR